ncbi:MAG: TonB-dependent receptor [Ignavibacteriae bacterium]|nr:TonB-dependent receptor [Ignavibacteriota bacterium]
MKRKLLCVMLMLSVGGALAGTVRVTVRDGEHRRPLAGAHCTIGVASIAGETDSTGRCVLTGVPAGLTTLRTTFVGYVPSLSGITVTEDVAVDVTVVLMPTVLPGQPMTVTATRGRERETPAAFSTLEGQSLRERHTVQDIPALLAELPSTTYYSESGNGIGYTYLNIRGFDARRIAVMVNGIPQNDPEDHNVYWLDLPDIAGSAQDIQVQRGAGSSFYGPPAIGGSVNLVTSHLGRERSLHLLAGIGSYNTRKYSAAFSSGLIENTYAMHARLSKIMSSGYRDRAWADFNSYFLGFARYDATMTTQVHIYGGPVSDGLAYYGIPKSDVQDRDRRRANPIARPEEIENFSQPHYELLHEWHLTPALTLNSTAFLVLGEGFFDYDGTWAPYSYYRITRDNGFQIAGDPDTLYLPGALIRAKVENRQWGFLPRLTWKHGTGEVIVGGEVRLHRSQHWGRVQWTQELPVGVPLDHRYYEYRGAKDMGSAYVHVIQDLPSDMTVMASLQYAYNRYRLYDEKFLGNDFAVPYHFLNPRVGLNLNLDPSWNLYTNIGYTQREPRLKNLYDAAEASTPASWGGVAPQFAQDAAGRFNFVDPLVTPEALLDVELGGGYTSDDVRLSVNLYWMEFTDEIVKSGQVDRFGQPITGNAARTRHLGIEAGGRVRIVEGLDVEAHATLSRNSFIRHRDYSRGSAQALDGNPIAGFPSFLANMRLAHRHGPFSFSLSARYIGKQYTDNFQDEARTVDPFFVADAASSWLFRGILQDVDVEAKVQVNNIFDTLYAAYGEGDQFFVGAERNAYFQIAIML